jgi:putative ABC transport system substrate-binding protein
MRRREFIALLGGAATWPVTARAQQPKVSLVGYMHAAAGEPSVAALRKGLSETGFIEGRNVTVEVHSANNDYNRLSELAADLVRRRVDVIVAGGGAVSVRAAKAATASIPIVFAAGADPVATGLVASLNRPGGNVTGISFLSNDLGPKRLGLLNELVPSASRYALLINPEAPGTESLTVEFRTAAASIGKQIEVFTASSGREIDSAFAVLVRGGANALVVGSSSLFNSRAAQLTTLAASHHMPAIYYDRRIVEIGGLMSYGADILDATRQSGIYVGRILKGEKATDLPVMRTTKFELVINLQTARVLGLTVSPTLLALADEVIE